MIGRPRRRSGGAAGVFVLLGILTILGVTFAAGTYAGRIWATRPHVSGPASSPERESGRGDLRSARIPEPPPRLTFYHELTAPLTAPPPPPKPAKVAPPPLATNAAPSTRRSVSARSADRAAAEQVPPDTVVARGGATTSPSRLNQGALASPATIARFTIQVAAYRLRPPAEALRATLAAAGHDARVVEADAPNGVRFRVQIGDFASRDAARSAAARLTGSTFVTTR